MPWHDISRDARYYETGHTRPIQVKKTFPDVSENKITKTIYRNTTLCEILKPQNILTSNTIRKTGLNAAVDRVNGAVCNMPSQHVVLDHYTNIENNSKCMCHREKYLWRTFQQLAADLLFLPLSCFLSSKTCSPECRLSGQKVFCSSALQEMPAGAQLLFLACGIHEKKASNIRCSDTPVLTFGGKVKGKRKEVEKVREQSRENACKRIFHDKIASQALIFEKQIDTMERQTLTIDRQTLNFLCVKSFMMHHWFQYLSRSFFDQHFHLCSIEWLRKTKFKQKRNRRYTNLKCTAKTRNAKERERVHSQTGFFSFHNRALAVSYTSKNIMDRHTHHHFQVERLQHRCEFERYAVTWQMVHEIYESKIHMRG